MNDVASLMHSAAARVQSVIASHEYANAIDVISSSRVLMTGIGKSGLVAQRCAATWRSFGLDATFEHTTELLHGGLGGWRRPCTIIIVSHSGTNELIKYTHTPKIVVTANTYDTPHREWTITYGFIIESAYSAGLPIVVNYVQAGILDALGLDLTEHNTGKLTKARAKIWHPGGVIFDGV